jgi:hypothetical protein
MITDDAAATNAADGAVETLTDAAAGAEGTAALTDGEGDERNGGRCCNEVVLGTGRGFVGSTESGAAGPAGAVGASGRGLASTTGVE